MLFLVVLAVVLALLQDNYKNSIDKCFLCVVVSGVGGAVGAVVSGVGGAVGVVVSGDAGVSWETVLLLGRY